MQAGRLPTWRNATANPQPLVLALCIVAAVALIGLELWPALSIERDAAAMRPAGKSAPPRDAANVDQITAADLFGHAANQNANLPQTDLQVTLRAVFAASDPKAASAVIETAGGSAQIVKVGGAIGSSAILQAVYPNRVVLSRNGALETLYFPTSQTANAMSVASDTALSSATAPADSNLPPGTSAEEIKRAAILQRLEELRARTPR